MRLILFVILNGVKNLLEEYFTTEFTENTEFTEITEITEITERKVISDE
jgi:hypothetical protein